MLEMMKESEKLLIATWKRKEKTVAKLLEKAHDKFDNKKYNSESTLENAIKNAYMYAKNYYTILPEVDSGKGYADVTFIPFKPDKPAMIVELKYNKTTNTGINQIKKMNYPERLELYKDNLLLVSINYDRYQKLIVFMLCL